MKRILTVFVMVVMSLAAVPVMALTEKQEAAIVDRCAEIREDLKTVQKDDARARVHLGGRYETILSKFIVPLNVRLVENNLSNADLVENQNQFAEAKATFANDYVGYQQDLEELVAMDCKNEPSEFYEKLAKVRQKRKTVEQDTLKLRNLISKQVKLVTSVRSKV